MRSKRRSIVDLFEGLAFPARLLGLFDENGAPGGGSSPSGGGASPASSGSPATPSGGAATNGVTPPGSSVAPGVEPPPGSPGSLATEPSEAPDFMSIFEGPPDPAPSFPGSEAPPAIAPPASPAVPAAPVTPPAAPAPAVAQPPAQPGAQPPGDGGQPPAATPPASGAVLDPYDPVALANHIQQNEAQITDYVAQSMFALTAEDLQALETDVAGTIPKLLAKGFVRSQQNLLMQINRLVPKMIERTTGDLQNYRSNEDAFYTKWPQLNRQTHGELVTRLGIMFRNANPKITRDQMIEELGPLVMMTAKVPMTAAPAASTTPLGQPAPRPQHQPSPFTPAIPGPAAQVSQTELSPIEAMFAPQE